MSIFGCLSAFFARGNCSTNHIQYLVGEVPEKNQGASLIRKQLALCYYYWVPAFDPQASRFSAKNAVLLAQLSNAAYRTQIDAETIVRQQLGFTDFYWIDLTKQFRNVYAIGARCDEFAVVALRGTQNVKDWMADIGRMIHFTSSGEPKLESPEWTNFLSRTFQSFRDFFHIATNLQTDVGDTAMDGYLQLVESQAAALATLQL